MEENRQKSILAEEDPLYLSRQIITYLGNKRALLGFIGTAVEQVKRELGQEKLTVADLFSGSGIVSRFMKQHADTLYANDLEPYCETINRCYLANREELDEPRLRRIYGEVRAQLESGPLRGGFLTELYSPRDDEQIQPGERAFYTGRNARYLDTARQLIGGLPEADRPFFLAPLLYEASVHTNTSGVFKGFYKNSQTGVGQFGGNGRNALRRILADVELPYPVFSRFSCRTHILRQDANALARELPAVDLAYMDPPYNQHPYGSNYFMLNLINAYERPEEISPVSGIPKSWNKSTFNRKRTAKSSMETLCADLKARYLLISFSDDGFLTREEMVDMLSALGEVRVLGRAYNTFRGCRNLGGRDIHVKEYLYLVKKG